MSNERIKIEEKQFDFLSPELKRPTKFIRRFQQGGNRFYYTINDKNGEITLYSSATTLIKDGYAEDNSAIESWRNKLRSEGKNPDYELSYLAMRGTLLHFLLGEYIQGKEIPLTNLHDFIVANAEELTDSELYYAVISKESTWLTKGIISFGAFVKTHNVKPLAIELIMASDKYKVASPIDLVCKMEIEEVGFFGEVYKTGEKKGTPKASKRNKEVIAIVDFKSTQSGFYDKHFLQLQLYKRIIKENYPKLEVECLFNWSPKDWTSTPSYNLKEQSSGRLEEVCETVFEQGRIKHAWKNPTVPVFGTGISMTQFDPETAYMKVPLLDYLKNYHQQKEKPSGERSKTTKKQRSS